MINIYFVPVKIILINYLCAMFINECSSIPDIFSNKFAKTFWQFRIFDRTWRAFFGLGSFGSFHWEDYTLISTTYPCYQLSLSLVNLLRDIHWLFCSKFTDIETNLAATPFILKHRKNLRGISRTIYNFSNRESISLPISSKSIDKSLCHIYGLPIDTS